MQMLAAENIEALRNLAIPTTSAQASVSGYHVEGDGGGGIFYWAPASNDAENGGLVIAPKTQAGPLAVGRWKRIFEGEHLNPRWFGAVGDGSSYPLSKYFKTAQDAKATYGPDVELTNEIDWVAIQCCINTLATLNATGFANGGGTVLIPRGTFLCDQELDFGPLIDPFEKKIVGNRSGISMRGVAQQGSVATRVGSASTIMYTGGRADLSTLVPHTASAYTTSRSCTTIPSSKAP